MKKRRKPREMAQRPPRGQGLNYTDRNLVAVNPNTEQFEPTEASPIPRRQRMAGVS